MRNRLSGVRKQLIAADEAQTRQYNSAELTTVRAQRHELERSLSALPTKEADFDRRNSGVDSPDPVVNAPSLYLSSAYTKTTSAWAVGSGSDADGATGGTGGGEAGREVGHLGAGVLERNGCDESSGNDKCKGEYRGPSLRSRMTA